MRFQLTASFFNIISPDFKHGLSYITNMKKTVLIMAAAFIAVACSGKSATPATEAVEEAQEVQIEAIDSTAVEVEAEWESTEETTEEVTEETTTEEVSN